MQTAIDRSYEYARLGDYKHAFEVLDEAHSQMVADGNFDPRLDRAHKLMRLEFLRDRARMSIFQEREDDALADLETLESLAPDFPEIDSLRHRALVKKARRVVRGADELLARKDFAGAMEAYIESQRLVPGFGLAEEGIVKVRQEMARLNARAQQQFLEAVRKVPEFRYIEVQWHAENVIHSMPGREDAGELRDQARRANAKQTFNEALACEQTDQFGAALMLYKSARDLDAGLSGVEEAVAKMETELMALGMLEQAQLDMRMGKFDEANEQLAEAFQLSTLSRGTISELMIESRKLEGEEQYRAALDLQILGKKVEALAAFEALSKAWPDGLEDEQARIDGLHIDIEGAKTEWAAAEAAEAAADLPKALDHFINAERYFADWRDGEVHIERLRKAIAAQEAAATPPTTGGTGGETGGEG